VRGKPVPHTLCVMATVIAPKSTETPHVSRWMSRRDFHHWVSVPLGLCVLGSLAFAVDMPAAKYFAAKPLPKFLKEVLDLSEIFGHAAGVGLIVLAVAVLDRSRRAWIGTCLLGAFGGGLMADAIKLLITRLRPRNIDLATTSLRETFGPLFPLASRTVGDSHSFPSAHTATAFGFAVVLAAMYPQGRWLFLAYAILTGWHRVECSAHFPSDVCFGAAVGWIVGNVVLALRKRMTNDQAQMSNVERIGE
jgi:membrane-associated phospholipid phosphatase